MPKNKVTWKEKFYCECTGTVSAASKTDAKRKVSKNHYRNREVTDVTEIGFNYDIGVING